MTERLLLADPSADRISTTCNPSVQCYIERTLSLRYCTKNCRLNSAFRTVDTNTRGQITHSARLKITGLLDFVYRPDPTFPCTGEGKETPTVLGSLKRANFNHWTTHVRSSKLLYHWQSVSIPWCRVPLWDLRSCRNVAVWNLRSCFRGAPSLTRTGL
jgi:hypothetical protein